MRKFFLLIMTIALITIGILGVTDSVDAQSNHYEAIDIYVELNEDGSAIITERWLTHLYEGTENYIVKENLGKSTIEDFTVTEDGQTYEQVKKWDIEASREEKKFKNGIVETKDGVELSWGIGEYGTHEYIIQYKVTNIVKQLQDSQMLFWTFSNEGINVPRSSVNVEIVAPKSLSDKEEKIWAYGYGGDIEFVNGAIVARTDEPLTIDNYVTILVKFENELFTTEDKVNETFEYILAEANKGSDYDTITAGFFQKAFDILKKILYGIGIIFVIVIAFVFRRRVSGGNWSFSSLTKRRKYKGQYYRDYPYEGNYLHAYYIVNKMGIGSFNTLLTSLLLKWMYEDKITINETRRGIFNRKGQEIHFLTGEVKGKTNEDRLFESLKNLAGKDHYITDRKLAKWAERNYKNIRKWERSVINRSKHELKKSNHLQEQEKKVFLMKQNISELTASGEEIEENIYKYMNYLHDFSLIAEHEAINVKIWDEIMIWAAYLNLTDVVMKQFEKLYPNYIEETKFKNNAARRSSAMANEVERRRRRQERKEQERRSSGSGGRASTGGGGGSYGGGSGGGTR